MRASEIARRRAEPSGAPLSWTSERSERGRQRLTSASLSERSEQCIWNERRCFSSASDDEVGGFQARCASSAKVERRHSHFTDRTVRVLVAD
jgi:hypothetical protein